jgi:hypothetical protein
MYARVATFEGGDGAKAAAEIKSRDEAQGGPPPGVPAKKLLILNDAAGSKVLAIAFFDTEDDYRQGDATLNEMSPPGEGEPGGMGQRTGVVKYEVVLELEV